MGLFAEVVAKWFKYLWIKSSKNQNMLRGFGAFGILGELRLSSPFSQQYKLIQKRNINIVLSLFFFLKCILWNFSVTVNNAVTQRQNHTV